MSDDGVRSAPAPPVAAVEAAAPVAGGEAGPSGRAGLADASESKEPPAFASTGDSVDAVGPETPTGSSSDADRGADKKWFELLPVILDKLRERGSESLEQFAMPRCARCVREGRDPAPEAELKCLAESCKAQGQPTCAACFIKSHAQLTGPGHKIEDLSKCPLCQLERVAFWCRDCELVFCDTCHFDIHRVRKARSHRRFAVGGASGTKIAKGDWSSHFHANVMQVLAVLKRPYSSDTSKPTSLAANVRRDDADSAKNGKRKRGFYDVEVISIDSDDDSGDGSDQTSSSRFKRTSNGPNINSNSSSNNRNSNSMIRPSSAPHLRANNVAPVSANVSAARTAAHQQHPVATMQYTPTSAPVYPQAHPQQLSIPPLSMPLPEPLPFPQELMAEGSPFGNTSSSRSNSFGSVSSSQQHSAFGVGHNQAASGVSSRGFNVPPIQTSAIGGSTASGWATASPGTSTPISIVRDSTSTSTVPANGMMTNYNVMLPGPDSVNVGNPLMEAMLGRYDSMNRAVFDLECRIQQLNHEIVTASSRGPYAATPFMAELTTTQTRLQAAVDRRDRLFVIAVVQSPDILRKVRQLRMTELMDVAQVAPLSHRKCLQLSYTINNHRKTLYTLHEQLAAAIGSSGMANASAVNMTIQQLSSSIAAHEQSMKQLVEDRQSEFVRIVQFSNVIREALKIEFRRFQQQSQEQLRRQRPQQYPLP